MLLLYFYRSIIVAKNSRVVGHSILMPGVTGSIAAPGPRSQLTINYRGSSI